MYLFVGEGQEGLFKLGKDPGVAGTCTYLMKDHLEHYGDFYTEHMHMLNTTTCISSSLGKKKIIADSL